MSQVLLSPEEFAHDLEANLGRANGNVYHRKPGVEGVHDGQIMVRLKKKRFIIIDYSIQPNEADLQAGAESPHIDIPASAGFAKCNAPECNKIGIPVCLYDSHPHEPKSLYMRNGLCFECQRNLNEKRRTERKRPKQLETTDLSSPSLIYALGPTQKKFKLNGKTIQLNDDAVIINGGVEGIRHYTSGECNYGFQEIGIDLQQTAQEADADTERLLNAVSSNTVAAAAVAATIGGDLANPGDVPSMDDHHQDIPTLYEKAFSSMNKAIFLLSQWKSSWDAAIAAANESVADPSLADAVASAAAVVAAAEASDHNGNNMVSLLLAADKRKDNEPEEQQQVGDAQEFAVHQV